MSVPPVPLPLDQIGERPFSFYPAIIGIEHNEWSYRRATWSEILVFNPQSNLEIWIPRRFVGEVSRIDEPVVIVGVLKELEYRGGMVLPHERRVIELPRAVNAAPAPAPAVVAGRRPPSTAAQQQAGAESKVGRMLLTAIAAGILICVAVIFVLRDGGKRIAYTPVVQSDLGFTGADDYWSVVNRLGKPDEDRWRSAEGELQYRLLVYPRQNLAVVLMGPDRKDNHYIGALDQDWHVVHSINSNTATMLRKLQRF